MNHYLLRNNWEHLYTELWVPLAETPSAPSDLFIELFRYASKKLRVEPNEEALKDPNLSPEKFKEIQATISRRIQALNDSQIAEEEFEKLPKPPDEEACIKLLEGFHNDVLSEFKTSIAQDYCHKLREFFENRNLRYALASNCRIQLSLTGLLISHYSILKKSAIQMAKASNPDPTRREIIEELEGKVGRMMDHNVEKDCIRVVSNLLEEVIVRKTTNGRKTLLEAWKGCPTNLFPHQSFEADVEGFWKFVCNYPGLRHPGTQTDKLRDLTKDDAILSIWLGVMLATFIADNDTYDVILAGNLE